MKKSRIIVGGLMLCAFVLSLSSCKSKRETKDAEAALVAAQNVENAAAVQVKVEKVFEEDVDQEEVYSASVIANTTNNRSNTYEDINHKENISEESKNRGVSFLRK